MTDTLVLNSGFVPIRTISDREAICLLYSNKAYSVIDTEKVLRSPSITIKVPSVISLIGYNKFPKLRVGFSKLNVIYRDDQQCMYCGKRFPMNQLTVDHIIPRSRWAIEKRTHKHDFSNWKNCTTACIYCNNKKGNNLLSELKWKLIREPFEPTYLPSIVITRDKAKERNWLQFCSFNVRLVYT